MNQNQPFECLYMGGSENIMVTQLDDNEAAATALNGKAFLVNLNTHFFFAGSTLWWEDRDGTSAYNSMMRYVHSKTADTLTLSCDLFVAEDIQDSNYLWPGIKLDVDWELKQVELHCDAAGNVAAENFVILLDADKGIYWDTTYYTKDMNGVSDIIWKPEAGPITISKNDLLYFTWANAVSANWGIKVWYRRLA